MILCNCTFTRPTSSWFSSDRLSDFFNVFNSSLSKGFVYGIIPIYWLGVGVYAVYATTAEVLKCSGFC